MYLEYSGISLLRMNVYQESRATRIAPKERIIICARDSGDPTFRKRSLGDGAQSESNLAAGNDLE